MLDIHNLSVYFTGKYLFKEISFQVNKGDRIGLIGKNGAGKSTLLKLIVGDESYESGNITYAKSVDVAMLRQDLDFNNDSTLWKEAEKAFEKIALIEERLEKLSLELSEREDYESDGYSKLLERINEANEQLVILGASQKDALIAKVLEGLGFTTKDWEKQTSEFSGGWRMRIELAKLLLKKPDILLLDEPTNHLDIESIVWLEKFLKSYAGAVILVSHDKAFLNAVCNRSIEIQSAKIYDYKGNYDKYLAQRELLLEQQLAEFTNQAKEKKRLNDLIEKFRYKSSKAAFAQTLIKKLEKMEDIDIDDISNKTMSFKFPPAIHSGKVVLKIEDLEKSFGDKQVLNKVNLELERGDKIAFVGQNGQGKSTLVKCIMKDWTDYTGELNIGHKVEIAYFAQDQAKKLDTSKTVLDTVLDEADADTRPKVRGLLGAFLFEGEDVDKKVSVLSGGERGRLALCLLLLRPHNLLILDEPTNHLDIQSKEILKQAILDYEGTVIIISHDREFLQGLTEKVLEFRDHKVKELLGDVDYYLQQREFENLREAEKAKSEKASTQKDSKQSQSDWQSSKELKKIKNKVGKLEREISDLEDKIAKYDVELGQAEFYERSSEDQASFMEKYNNLKQKLDDVIEEWETALMQLEE